MLNKELEEKIDGMDLNSIFDTSPKALKELTYDFSEPLVRLLMMKTMTISGQKGLLKFIKKAYGILQKRVNPLWSEHPVMGGYPDYFDTMEANIDSDRIITTSGSVPVESIEYYKLVSQQSESKSSETYNKDMVDAAIAAVRAQIPHLEYNQQDEKLSFVYGKDKEKVNLDDVIEKKTKEVVNKTLEELECSDEDIDEMFADVYGQDLVDQVNKEMAEKEKKDDEEWDDSMDYVFNKKVNPHALFNAMKVIKYSSKITDRRFYYVAYRVFDAINYISKGTSEHQYLQWINLHFNDNEHRWIDDHGHIYLFRFKLDGSAKELKVHPSKWNTIKMYSGLAEIHYNLAKDLKNTFTFIVDDDGNELEDSESYEHLKDYPQFLSGATWYVDKYLIAEDAYINRG